MYREDSDDNTGTLKHLKVISNRTFSADAHKDVAAVTEFIELVTDAYVTSAAMDHLQLESTTSTPKQFKDIYAMASKEKQVLLNDIAAQFVDNYILRDHDEILIRALAHQLPQERLLCRQDGCTKSYRYSKCRQRHEQQHHGLYINPPESATAVDPEAFRQDDHMYNYSTAAMKLGLLHRNVRDAIREGDGGRLAMLWKFLMFLFHCHGHSKYALEGLLLTARLQATLSPRAAELMKWNRSVNTKGGPGNNIPLDLALEHLNHATKADLKHLGANITEVSARRCSQSAGYLNKVLEQLDEQLDVAPKYGRHATLSTKEDFTKILDKLKRYSLTLLHEGREHSKFKSFLYNVFKGLKIKKLYA